MTGALGAAGEAPDALHLDQARGKDWRESFYFNLVDPARTLAAFFTVAFRPARRSGDALLVMVRHDHVIQSWVRGWPDRKGSAIRLGGLTLEPLLPGRRWRARFQGEAGVFPAAAYPPGLIGVLAPLRKTRLDLVLEFDAVGPLVDYRRVIRPEWEPLLRPLGLDHREQLGHWCGEAALGRGVRPIAVAGPGSRDHSWGERQWLSPDGWTNHAASFPDGRWFHCLRVRLGGRELDGGFIGNREHAAPLAALGFRRLAGGDGGDGGDGGGFRLELEATNGARLHATGRRLLTARIPLAISKRLRSHLRGQPWAAVIEEGQAEYRRDDGAIGYGLDEMLHNRGPLP